MTSNAPECEWISDTDRIEKQTLSAKKVNEGVCQVAPDRRG